ncbi:MFS transporter [Streptosporangium lutulentum]
MTTEIATDVSTARSTGPWTLLAAATGFLMISLDATIVNVALPTLSRELDAGLTQLQWVVDGYTLMFAGLLLTGGSLGDRLGARRVFACGLGLFVLASLACGLAVSPAMLIAARFVQGVGAAAQLPASLAMIRHGYPDQAGRTRAIAIWAAAGGAAVAAGPVLGGLLIAGLGWRSLFLVNLVIGAVGLLLTVRADAPPAGTGRRLTCPVNWLSCWRCARSLSASSRAARWAGHRVRCRPRWRWRWSAEGCSCGGSAGQRSRCCRCGCSPIRRSPRPARSASG